MEAKRESKPKGSTKKQILKPKDGNGAQKVSRGSQTEPKWWQRLLTWTPKGIKNEPNGDHGVPPCWGNANTTHNNRQTQHMNTRKQQHKTKTTKHKEKISTTNNKKNK